MGGCNSSEKNKPTPKDQGSAAVPQYLGKGHIPKKIVKTKNPNIYVPDVVYLFGGSKILQFDTKTKKISHLAVHPAVPLPKRTQCEFLTGLNKIATLGGSVDGKITNIGYVFDPKDWTKVEKLPNFPKAIRYTTLAYVDGYLYTIGGQTDHADPEAPEDKDHLMKEVYRLKLGQEIGHEWELFAKLPKERRSANVMVANGIIHVFGGCSTAGLKSTQIDTINTKTKETSQLEVRLPLGVEGARICWNGDDLLLIGGCRDQDKPDGNVLVLDFEKKAIMSMR
jgi:hypothetical protein